MHLSQLRLFHINEVASLLGVTVATVRRWGKRGIIKTYPYNDRNGCLYEHPGLNSPLMKKEHNILNTLDFIKQ